MSTVVFGQESLDMAKNASCELFSQKAGYDSQQRIDEIGKHENQRVTVYVVKGKDNKIKSSYTGTLKKLWKDDANLSDKIKSGTIAVETEGSDGKKNTNIPPTDDMAVRIYLADCLVK